MPKITLKSSQWLAGLLVFLHLVSFYAVIIVSLPNWLRILSGFGCLASLIYSLRQHVYRINPGSILTLIPKTATGWVLETHSGMRLIGSLKGTQLRTAWLIILNFKVSGRRSLLPIIIFKDSLSSHTFRQLKVFIKVHAV